MHGRDPNFQPCNNYKCHYPGMEFLFWRDFVKCVVWHDIRFLDFSKLNPHEISKCSRKTVENHETRIAKKLYSVSIREIKSSRKKKKMSFFAIQKWRKRYIFPSLTYHFISTRIGCWQNFEFSTQPQHTFPMRFHKLKRESDNSEG